MREGDVGRDGEPVVFFIEVMLDGCELDFAFFKRKRESFERERELISKIIKKDTDDPTTMRYN